MWTRAELKARAKNAVRRYYWAALAVCLICSLLNGGGNSGKASAGANAGVNVSQEYNVQVPMDGDLGAILSDLPHAAEEMIGAIDPVVGSVMLLAVVIGLAVGLAVSVFVAPIIEIGKNRFFMESRAAGYSAGLDELLWGFRNHYLNLVWVMFLRGLIVFLGTICCVVPGIYFGYCYYMVPYILAENPEMKAADALKLSKDMMDGHKLNTWVLEISFIGWWILGAMTCGIGTALIQPYYEATLAELYAVLRNPFAFGLHGFGIPEMGPSGGGYYDGGYGSQSGYYGDLNGNGGQGGYYSGPNGNGSQGGYYGGPNGNGSQGGYYGGPNGGGSQGRYYGGPNGGGSQGRYYGDSGNGSSYQDHFDGYSRNGSYGFDAGNMNGAAQPPAERGGDVKQSEGRGDGKRSEGGPGRGYYLNGVFYPYTEDELEELNRNQK